MILKPIALSHKRNWEIQQEQVMRAGWVVRWDGQHFEATPPAPLPPITRKRTSHTPEE